jgi:Fe-S-cluster containining protein
MADRAPEREWFDGRGGLRFSCTQCGNCCSGSAGYVLVSVEEIRTLSARLGIDEAEFRSRHTKRTDFGTSLVETRTAHGLDCVFLDRESKPGRAICGVYEDRPAQCRAWPFWGSNLKSQKAWREASRGCPGMGKGRLYPVEEIRIQRASESG